ncbi:unnamed protein product, partial [Brassica oleracea var. botrytis]
LVPHSPPPCPSFIGGVRNFMDKKITDFDERIVVCEILL